MQLLLFHKVTKSRNSKNYVLFGFKVCGRETRQDNKLYAFFDSKANRLHLF